MTPEENFMAMIAQSTGTRTLRTMLTKSDPIFQTARYKYLVLDDNSNHVGEWFFDIHGNFLGAKAT